MFFSSLKVGHCTFLLPQTLQISLQIQFLGLESQEIFFVSSVLAVFMFCEIIMKIFTACTIQASSNKFAEMPIKIDLLHTRLESMYVFPYA